MYCDKVVSCLVKTTMKHTLFLYLPCKTSLYFHPFGKAESRKPKTATKVLRKLYYSKATASRKATLDSTHLVGVLLFSSRNIFQKLNQT